MPCFCPSCEEELGVHDRYCIKCGFKMKAPTQSPPDNIKRTNTLNDFIQEKENMAFLSKKRFGITVVLLLVQDI